MTKFSIIITCFKQERFIRQAVDSALALPNRDQEIIVVDDASPDCSPQILKEYGDRIQLIRHEKNLGANAARNTGAAVAHGDFLVFLDGDDCFLPWALDLYASIIKLKKPKVILCRMLFFEGVTPQPQFRDFGKAVEIAEYDAVLHKDHCYRGSASALVIERGAFLNVGGFTREIFPCELEDLTTKLGFSCKTIQILSHPTTAYRMHDLNTVHQIGLFVAAMGVVARKEKNGEYPGGSAHRLERYAYLGGPAAYWFVRALRDDRHGPALGLLADSWSLMAVAVCSRLSRRIKGPSTTQWIKVPFARSALVAVPVPAEAQSYVR
ncbi:MAG: glycosyltransferase family 2 protein [Candidatus Sulfotelmatobacter sp.]